MKAVESNIVGSRPKELFMDAVEGLERQYKDHRKILKKAVQALADHAPPVILDASSFLKTDQEVRGDGELPEEQMQENLAVAMGLGHEPQEDVYKHFDQWASACSKAIEEHLDDEDLKARVQSVPLSSWKLFYAEWRDRKRRADLRAFEDVVSLLDRRIRTSPQEAAFVDADEECEGDEAWEEIPGGERARKWVFEIWKAAESRIEKDRSARRAAARDALRALLRDVEGEEQRGRSGRRYDHVIDVERRRSRSKTRSRSRSRSRIRKKHKRDRRDLSASSGDVSPDRRGRRRDRRSSQKGSRKERHGKKHRQHGSRERSRSMSISADKKDKEDAGSEHSFEEGEVV